MVPILIVPLSVSEDLFRERLTLFCARKSLSLASEHIPGELVSEEEVSQCSIVVFPHFLLIALGQFFNICLELVC